MFEGYNELLNEARLLRQDGLKLYFPTSDYAQMGFFLFLGVFFAILLAIKVDKLV